MYLLSTFRLLDCLVDDDGVAVAEAVVDLVTVAGDDAEIPDPLLISTPSPGP